MDSRWREDTVEGHLLFVYLLVRSFLEAINAFMAHRLVLALV